MQDTNNMMNTIKVVVVDDEPMCVMGLVERLNQEEGFEVLATTTSPQTAVGIIQKLEPDVVFLDVEMPHMSGFDVLQKLRGKVSENLMVIFYTAFDKYMIDALRASAFDFLLKPYQPFEFDTVIGRIRNRMEELRGNMLALGDSGLSDRMLALDNFISHRVAIQTVSGLLMVNPSDVFSFTFINDSRIWLLKMADGSEHRLKKQINARQLLAISESFVQVRQDVIINLDFLMSIENYTLRCIFAPPFDKEDIQVSRRCFKGVKDKLDIF